MKYIVTGGAGFIGSHLVDRLIELNHTVIILDNLISGFEKNINSNAIFYNSDITILEDIEKYFVNIDGIFHLAAIARTPWCINDPILAYQTNVMGTLNILEIARKQKIKRIVMTSSNVIYAYWTPYRSSKEALESLGKVYTEMYNLSVICLRNSNVYGSRQSEIGPSPNVFSALRKCKNINGYIEITGNGEQSRDFTHVSDIVNGHIMAMNSNVTGIIDLCTGINHTLNEIGKYFDCEIKYINDRPGDIKHIYQDPIPSFQKLNWKAIIPLEKGIQDFFSDISYEKQKIYIITVCYRAIEPQLFRRNELINLIQNIKKYFKKTQCEYKLVICEQNNKELFNRGKLLNIAFILSEKTFNFSKLYIHINTDYNFDDKYTLPDKFINFKKGFLDLFNYYSYPVLGACCLFDSESYNIINGFPNDLVGWGGDDWAIFNRIKQKNIFYDKCNGYVLECYNNNNYIRDETNNDYNINLAKRNDLDINGINSCIFNIDTYGEFHDDNIIYHYKVS